MLTGKQKRYLRAAASLINPAAIVGKEGLTDEVVAEIRTGLEANELVKIKIGRNSPEEPSEVIAGLEVLAGVEVVQKIGRNIVLFKQKKRDSEFKLP